MLHSNQAEQVLRKLLVKYREDSSGHDEHIYYELTAIMATGFRGTANISKLQKRHVAVNVTLVNFFAQVPHIANDS